LLPKHSGERGLLAFPGMKAGKDEEFHPGLKS
jgi:hypothetical protein